MNTDFMGTSTASAFESWFENIGRKIKSAFQKVGTWFKNTFGFVVKKSDATSTKADYIIAAYEHGTGYETVISGEEKPITFYVSTPSNPWRFWEYSLGISINIDKFHFSTSHSLIENNIEIGYGDTAVNAFIGLLEAGFGVSHGSGDAYSYSKFYVKSYMFLLAALALVPGGAVVLAWAY